MRDCIDPAHAHDGEIRLRKERMRPVGWLVPRGVHKALVLCARDRTNPQLEPIDEDAIRRPLVLVAELSAHGEPAPRNRRKTGGERRRSRIGHHAIIVGKIVASLYWKTHDHV